MKNRIIIFHLLNGYTGSVKVLRDIIEILLENNFQIEVVTSNTDGFLNNIKDVSYTRIAYKWHKYRFITLFLYVFAQVSFFFIALKKARNYDIHYINTVVPFGASFGCFLMSKKVIYHIHEIYNSKSIISIIYLFFLRISSIKIIYVSNYLRNAYSSKISSIVIPNSLSDQYFEQVKKRILNHDNKQFDLLLVSSLKKYKGIYNFIELARLLPNRKFLMVLSCSENEIVEEFKNVIKPTNLFIYPLLKDLHKIYSVSKINLNLTDPDERIESFGMTILESMAYGIPNIVPPIGGPADLISNNETGFCVHPSNYTMLVDKIEYILNNSEIYEYMSDNTKKKALQFRRSSNVESLIRYITN